ncbi:non-ribosomal peptide synthetase [Streptomyces olivaceiscleroticus]|uniref:Carrier domain-containing protein n=1 Tax=Streptomyces olivaceiscleroticus TaxID=68245 RepID=A0ABN1AIG7_9ACTN
MPDQTGLYGPLDALAEWAERTPTALATTAPDGSFTFAELADLTDRTVRVLASEGVGHGTPVATALGRSRESLAALLAVWRLGATAVLIDERHPAERLSFVLRDSGAQVLLAHEMPEGAVPPKVRRVDLNAADPHGEVSPVAPDATDCAYVIYTSGTTGWPKGVEVSYGAMAHFVSAVATLGLAPGGTGINAVSPSFDGWLWCALLYLVHGQGMAIIDLYADDAGSVDLGERIEAIGPRTVCLTPSLLAGCVESIESAEVVVVAGEQCPARLAERLRTSHRVLNVYGPTETTIAATWADSAAGDDVVTIGRPLPGYSAYVLDEQQRTVGPGVAGELYIGGPAVATGYRGRPELTVERFLPDPFGPTGARMYRTGDLVMARTDQQLEYLGRVDNQLKVNGTRVALDEIERVAVESAHVRSAVAYLLPSGDAIGVAVIAAEESGTNEAIQADVRDRLRARFPESIAPRVIDLVESIPATPNGKADRSALARSSAEKAEAIAGQAPRTAYETQVCAVWSDELERPVTDVQADFFDIGGHSLLAARVIARLRRETGVRLTVRHLLDNPTAAALAAELDRLATQANAMATS